MQTQWIRCIGRFVPILLFAGGLTWSTAGAQTPASDLRVVLIRHAEKPQKGDNLDCRGLNRSLRLAPLLYSRFGIPTAIFVPAMEQGAATKHARMFQTIVPFAAKYNLALSTTFGENDTLPLAAEIVKRHGTVLVVWEHKRIPSIARSLGVEDDSLHWSDDDYDSLWIVTWKDGKARLVKEREGIDPASSCPP